MEPDIDYFEFFDQARRMDYRLPLLSGPGIDGPTNLAATFLLKEDYDYFLSFVEPIESRFGLHDSYQTDTKIAFGGDELVEEEIPAFKQAWADAFTQMGYTVGEWKDHPSDPDKT